MSIRLLGSIFRLRRLAEEFGHFWSYAVSPEDICEFFKNSRTFGGFQKRLARFCALHDECPLGGRYFEDARYEDGWLMYGFGRHNQILVAIQPQTETIRAEYVGAEGPRARATYDSVNDELSWDVFPQHPRDAIRVLRAIASLTEHDPRLFVNTHLPEELDTDEAELYKRARSWGYLLINPADLKDLLSTPDEHAPIPFPKAAGSHDRGSAGEIPVDE